MNNPCYEIFSLIKAIDNLSLKSSCGIDKITTKLLKIIMPYITKSIAFIMNQSLLSGVFEDKIKIAKLVPISKKNRPALLDNFFPISLLPAFTIFYIFKYLSVSSLINYMITLIVTICTLAVNTVLGKKHSTEIAVPELLDETIELMN